ncbi:MAG: hypothetical protein H6712_14500 [Myxococcales bacterium]|nr:hypothetical protein [Myxococcales bacterium]MCB9715074.1 hypothetical protein [Myxococcales bacterium]
MTDARPPRIDLLVLARLATTKGRPLSVGKLEQDLFPFVEARLSRREWSSSLTDCLASLRKRREIDDRRVPTTKGLERLHEALGVRTLPERWSRIWRALMPALALQLPGRRWSDVASAEKLRARLIRQEHELSLPEAPTLTQAVDAQAWRALGLDETGPLTLGKLRRALLERTLGASLRERSIDTTRAGQWLATAAVETTTREIAAVQRALVSRWLFEDEGERDDAVAPSPPTAPKPTRGRGPNERRIPPSETSQPGTRPPSSEPLSLEGWARRVVAIARATRAGRYGDERAFIASVWHAAQAEPDPLPETLAEFKTRLVEANRAGLLRLHRADLVGAMDDRLVRESEARHLNAIFHFIEIPLRSIP